jgi:hypothetical protein
MNDSQDFIRDNRLWSILACCDELWINELRSRRGIQSSHTVLSRRLILSAECTSRFRRYWQSNLLSLEYEDGVWVAMTKEKRWTPLSFSEDRQGQYRVLQVLVYQRRADTFLLSVIQSSSAYSRLDSHGEQCWYSTTLWPKRESIVLVIICKLTFYSLHMCLSFNSQMYIWLHHLLSHVFYCFHFIIRPVASVST